MTNQKHPLEAVAEALESYAHVVISVNDPDEFRPKFEDGGVQARQALITLREFIADEKPVNGDTSDGYHTFNELYEHRHALFIALTNAHKSRSWKSKHHSDGSMFDGWFIAGISTTKGQATYHIPIRLWDDFDIDELQCAPPWDGHTSEEALDRIKSLKPDNEPKVEGLAEALGNVESNSRSDDMTALWTDIDSLRVVIEAAKLQLKRQGE